MFHSNTERLIDYWRARKEGEESPARASIDPTEFSGLMPQVFILGRQAPGRFAFRLVGGLIADLHQRDLRQADFMSLWGGDDRLRVAAALETARKRAEAIVVVAKARNAMGMSSDFEILMAPLSGGVGQPDRMLGLFQPTSPMSQLMGQPVQELSVMRVVSSESPMEAPRLRLAAVDGRRIA